VIEKQREVKSATEIRLIQKACQITVRVLKTVLRELKFGQTELEVAQKIAQLAARFGAEKLSFDSIVAFGENAACPHAKPGTRKLKHGDAALFDLGVVYRGYSSDMTRTFFTAPPTSKQKQIYEAVLAAQQAGLATIRSGVKAATVDAAVRKILKTAGYEKQFTHSTGHGVGLQIHEAPSLSPKSKEILKNNMIITCEPGVYLAEEFGVRIEDSVAVTRSGAKILTNFSKKLRVLKI
jgi:Xaa-Pro aminopeptidase